MRSVRGLLGARAASRAVANLALHAHEGGERTHHRLWLWAPRTTGTAGGRRSCWCWIDRLGSGMIPLRVVETPRTDRPRRRSLCRSVVLVFRFPRGDGAEQREPCENLVPAQLATCSLFRPGLDRLQQQSLIPTTSPYFPMAGRGSRSAGAGCTGTNRGGRRGWRALRGLLPAPRAAEYDGVADGRDLLLSARRPEHEIRPQPPLWQRGRGRWPWGPNGEVEVVAGGRVAAGLPPRAPHRRSASSYLPSLGWRESRMASGIVVG